MTEKKPDKRERISGRLKTALDLMIWGDENGKPLDWNVACRNVNISARSMRKSLERPAVRRYLYDQKQVFRACIGAKSLSRLDEIAAQRSNMNAAVLAIRQIDGLEVDSHGPPGMQQSAGITIRILAAPPPPQPLVDVARTIEHEDSSRPPPFKSDKTW
jgi:hypothetical protein